MRPALDALGGLDPDDPRQSSHQIADRIRRAILDNRLGPGDRLPSQSELASRYGVARETVKRALDVLRNEHLIVSRQGSGVFVRTQMQRPVELRPHVAAVFDRPAVTLDFAGISGETLRDALSEVLDQVRSGSSALKSLHIRMLVADATRHMAVPRSPGTPSLDARLASRLGRIVERATTAIVDQVHELGELGMLDNARAEVKMLAVTPTSKVYIINGEECFFGFYPIAARPLTIDGQGVEILDMLGKDVPLLHFSSDDETGQGAQFVAGAQQWFDSLWNTIATDVAD